MFALLLTLSAHASVFEYSDRAVFDSFVTYDSTVDLQAYADGTPLIGQYPGSQLYFLVGDNAAYADPAAFPTDGMGTLPGANGDLWLQAYQDTNSIAFDYPGALRVELYDRNFNLLHTSGDFGGFGAGHFLGITADFPFHYIHVTDWADGTVYVDNIYLAHRRTFQLDITGTCPGAVDISITGANPFNTLVIFSGDAPGAFVLPVGPCAGTVTGVSARGARAITYTSADANGEFFRFGQTVGRSVCGKVFQVLDQATCELSNAEYMP